MSLLSLIYGPGSGHCSGGGEGEGRRGGGSHQQQVPAHTLTHSLAHSLSHSLTHSLTHTQHRGEPPPHSVSHFIKGSGARGRMMEGLNQSMEHVRHIEKCHNLNLLYNYHTLMKMFKNKRKKSFYFYFSIFKTVSC
jgi:hypothetical protein